MGRARTGGGETPIISVFEGEGSVHPSPGKKREQRTDGRWTREFEKRLRRRPEQFLFVQEKRKVENGFSHKKCTFLPVAEGKEEKRRRGSDLFTRCFFLYEKLHYTVS